MSSANFYLVNVVENFCWKYQDVFFDFIQASKTEKKNNRDRYSFLGNLKGKIKVKGKIL